MRFLFAAITLAAAGVGFSYLDQTTPASSATERTPLRPLFKWELEESESVVGEPASMVRDTVKRVQAQSDTILDNFVRDHQSSDHTLDDALAQVRKAAKGPLDQTDVASDELIAAAPASENEDVRDDLARANPSDIQAESTPYTGRYSSSSVTVHEATIVRNGKRTQAAATPQLAQIAANEQAASKASTQAIDRKTASSTEWKAVGKTTEGRSLHTRRFGKGGPRTLIVAGLDGEDRIAVRWIDQLSDEMARRPELFENCEALVFRAGNPDGLTKRISENARGVLINRNFPSRRYRPLPDMSSGTGPATEAETRALLDNLYTFHPRRVIHLKATTARTDVAYNRPAREIATSLQQAYNLNIHPLDIEQLPGSLEDFADGTLEAGVLSIQLNVADDWQQIWSKHQPTILTAITGRVPGKVDSRPQPQDELARSAPEASRSSIPVSNTESLRKKARTGYEELSAPPQ